MTTTEPQATGVTCRHCGHAVAQAVSQVSGVDSVEVAASTGPSSSPAPRPSPTEQVPAAGDEAGCTATRSA